MPSATVKVANVWAVLPVALPTTWNWLPRRERISVARNMFVAKVMFVKSSTKAPPKEPSVLPVSALEDESWRVSVPVPSWLKL